MIRKIGESNFDYSWAFDVYLCDCGREFSIDTTVQFTGCDCCAYIPYPICPDCGEDEINYED